MNALAGFCFAVWLFVGAPVVPAADPTSPISAPAAALPQAHVAQLGRLPALLLPSIDQELVSLGAAYQFSVGTGLMPHLGPDTTAAFLHVGAEGTYVRLPMWATAAGTWFRDGRRHGYGVRAQGSLGGVFVHRLGQHSGGLQLDLGSLWGHWRHYATTSLASPWYVEGALGLQTTVLSGYGGPDVPFETLYRIPLRADATVGRGRIVPIDPRLRLQKLEQMLLEAGIIGAPLQPEVVRNILRIWWALRNELGYAARLRHTLQLIDDAHLLRRNIDQETAYKYGRIFVDSALAQREQGHDSRLTLRFGPTFARGMAPLRIAKTPVTMVLLLQHRQVHNLGVDRELRVEPMVQFALRRADRADNITFASTAVQAAYDYARLLVVAPASYRHFVYDARYNPRGIVGVRARMGVAFDVASRIRPNQDNTNVMVGAGVDYTFLRNRATGLTAAADMDVGYAFGALAYVVGAQLKLAYGHKQVLYTGPVEVVDCGF